jgi:16S rRNA (guanine966-N2)-methyltransferase
MRKILVKKTRAGQLRIVAGIWRSRLLQIADVEGLRPTSARIRETLFNWLASDIHGVRCLDLCAGTGALGIEALSRGAAEVVFVERSRVAADILRRNLESLDASGAETLIEDARDYLTNSIVSRFDIVFLDPPFAADLHDELCRIMSEREWLAPNAKIYIELSAEHPEPSLPGDWAVVKNKTAGNVRYMLVTNKI